MKMQVECISCFVKQAEKAVGLSTDDFELRLKILKKVLNELSNLDHDRTPPEIATDIYKLIIRETGNKDAYKTLKEESNKKVKELIEKYEGAVENSDNPFGASIRLSLCGNIIDYGLLDGFDIEKVIEEEFSIPVDSKKIRKFREKIMSSAKIVFLADNAGEIGFDGLFLNEVQTINPGSEIYLFVKSAPIINDATIEDAKIFDLDKKFKIIEFPDSVGFSITDMTRKIKDIIDSADLVISKGQANYEILSQAGFDNIVYLLRAKCKVVAADLKVDEGSGVIRL